MRTTTRLKLAYGALAAADTLLAGSRSRWAHRARLVTKPMLMPVLAASLATDERARGARLRSTALTGQAFGWGGDVLLLGEGPRAFSAGARSFGVGHVAYISGFLRHRERSASPLQNQAVRGAAAAWLVTAPAVALAAGRQERALGATVLGYSAVLTSMVAAASHLGPEVPRDACLMTAAGAGLFLLSDSVLGARTFLLQDPPQRLEAVVMATYTAGQLLISEGAARS
ncbi:MULTISPECIES: lysoplasmalogenase [unclassified Nocardioides]|uniref:lysoplasmalogenase n=1 Tax=unclassified Nocardioides TaxID=2615069 RepID=UPI00048AAB11|nr:MULTISPECIES: lysoplasmalogenase [unclassified Nocardioides]